MNNTYSVDICWDSDILLCSKGANVKICSKCNEQKELTEFGSGRGYCNPCRNRERRERKQKYIPQLHTPKKCNTCGEVKLGKEYALCKENKDGLRGTCRECTSFVAKKRIFGVGREEYNTMLKEQKGKCKICRTDKPSRLNAPNTKFAIDHCHATKKVRGLLCDACNKGLGHFEDKLENLDRALRYISSEGDIECLT